jgi:hypothetical protein
MLIQTTENSHSKGLKTLASQYSLPYPECLPITTSATAPACRPRNPLNREEAASPNTSWYHALLDPDSKNIHFDISWDETAKYLVGTYEATKVTANIINRFPEWFLFGTDSAAPRTQEDYLKTYNLYAPLLAQLTPKARRLLLKGNCERIFDEARQHVRKWEAANKPR